MAIGLGGFTAYDKKLPGTYMRFISLADFSGSASARGIAAAAISCDWGKEGEILSVTEQEYASKKRELFGGAVLALDEIFRNASLCLVYRVNTPNAKAASCDLGTAVCKGSAGNRISIKTENDADNEGGTIVTTLFDGDAVDVQRVKTSGELRENAFVKFQAEASLESKQVYALTGGSNGTANIGEHEKFLNLLESEDFDTLCLASDDSDLKALYKNRSISFRKSGKRTQCVLYHTAADSEAVLNVANEAEGENPAALVYWVCGLQAGTQVGSTAFHRVYDGSLSVKANFTQKELEEKIEKGEFVLHKVGRELRVLADKNSLTSFDGETGEIFSNNETVRTVDWIAENIAALFSEKYMGKIPNSIDGRISLKSDIQSLLHALRLTGAIEEVPSENLTVEAGEDKGTVLVRLALELVGSLTTLYLTTVLS